MGISAFWLGINLHWAALLMIIVPAQIEEIAPASKAQTLGAVVGYTAVVAAFVPLIVGSLSDRCRSRWGRRRPYMVAGVAVNLVGLLTLYAAGALRNLALYVLGYVVCQLGNNIATGSYCGVIPDMVPEGQRGESSGYMAVMTQVGTVLGALGAGVLMSGGHAAASFFMIAAVLVASLVISCLSMREAPLRAAPKPVSLKQFLCGLWIDPRRHPDFAWVWLTRALVTMSLWTVQEFLQYFIGDMNNVADKEMTAGYVLTVSLVGATFAGLIGGKISDSIGRKPVVYASNAIMAVTALALAASHTLMTTYVVAAAYGIGYGAYCSVDWALGCDVLPDKEGTAAKDMGIWHISMTLPQTLAVPLAGAVLACFSHLSRGSGGEMIAHYSRAGYACLFGLTALYVVAAGILLRNVRGVR
jgi:MFS family permease